MNKRLIILLVTIVSALIFLSPIVSAEVNALKEFDWNPFADHSDDLKVSSMHIKKVKKIHTNSKGKTKKSTKFYLSLNVKTNLDQMKNYTVKVDCIDKKGNLITTVESYVNTEGTAKIPLTDASGIKKANVTILDDSNNVIYKNVTSKIKTTKKVTKDKPAPKKSSSSSSSSSSPSVTYWASSKSNIFHKPGCEWAQKISGRNKIVFHSRDKALSSGFRPCQVCCP